MSRKKQLEESRNKTKLIMKGNPQGYYKSDTKMNFKVSKSSIHYKKVPDLSLFPTFNNDKCHYTPAFILPHLETMKEEEYKKLHQHKVEESIKELSTQQILVPKPRSKHKYCGVCRTYYEQYLEHCQSKQHCEKLQQSKFQKVISLQCNKFQHKNLEPEMLSIEKNISFETKMGDEEISTETLQKTFALDANDMEMPNALKIHNDVVDVCL